MTNATRCTSVNEKVYGDLWRFVEIYGKLYSDINSHKFQPGFRKSQYDLWASVRGGPCSLLLLQFPLLLPAPFNFLPFAPFLLFPCSFFIFLCSLLLFSFSSCSMLLFQIFHCFMLLFTIFGAPCSRITLVCTLLLYLFYGLLLAHLCQIGLAHCSGITPNGGSSLNDCMTVYVVCEGR